MDTSYETWWSEEDGGDLSMEKDHEYAWPATIDLLDPKDILDKKILDFGCNRGVLLRKLYDRYPYEKAVGVDLARQSIAAAKENSQDYPITFYIEDNIANLTETFHTAISTSVLYLIEDLNDHISKIHDLLLDGGVYYTSFTDQSKNPSLAYMKQEIDKYGAVKMQNHTLTQVVDCFLDHGFQVELIREHTGPHIDVSGYQRFHLSVDDYLQSIANSFMIKARKIK